MALSRILLSIVAVLGLVGCGSDARVSVRYHEVGLLPPNTLTVTVDDGDGARTLRGVEINANGGEPFELETRTSGTLRIGFRFADGANIASEGTVEVPLRADWRYGMDIFVDSLNPAVTCFGCQGSRAFALGSAYRRTIKDSVWVVWGGNSIKNPVIY